MVGSRFLLFIDFEQFPFLALLNSQVTRSTSPRLGTVLGCFLWVINSLLGQYCCTFLFCPDWACLGSLFLHFSISAQIIAADPVPLLFGPVLAWTCWGFYLFNWFSFWADYYSFWDFLLPGFLCPVTPGFCSTWGGKNLLLAKLVDWHPSNPRLFDRLMV